MDTSRNVQHQHNYVLDYHPQAYILSRHNYQDYRITNDVIMGSCRLTWVTFESGVCNYTTELFRLLVKQFKCKVTM